MPRTLRTGSCGPPGRPRLELRSALGRRSADSADQRDYDNMRNIGCWGTTRRDCVEAGWATSSNRIPSSHSAEQSFRRLTARAVHHVDRLQPERSEHRPGPSFKTPWTTGARRRVCAKLTAFAG